MNFHFACPKAHGTSMIGLINGIPSFYPPPPCYKILQIIDCTELPLQRAGEKRGTQLPQVDERGEVRQLAGELVVPQPAHGTGRGRHGRGTLYCSTNEEGDKT